MAFKARRDHSGRMPRLSSSVFAFPGEIMYAAASQMKNGKSIEDAFVGCIMGCAVGDALGAPHEWSGVPDVSGAEELFRDFAPIRNFAKGTWTDDTQLTLALAESIAQRGEISGSDFANRIADFFRRGETPGWGISITTAASNMALGGAAWNEMGDKAGKAGNGCAMRAGPIGLWLHDDIEAIPDAAREISIVTHKDPRAIAGATAVATAVAYCTSRRSVEREELLSLLVRNTSRHGDALAEKLNEMSELLEEDGPAAVEKIIALGQFGPHRGSWGGRITPFVLPTVMICIYWFLRCPTDYKAAVGNTITSGGDVDTTGAICGAISGALNGAASIPANLRTTILESDRLKQTAKRLYRAKRAGKSY